MDDRVTRRGFLAAILAAGAAPAIVRASSLMPLWVPSRVLLGVGDGTSTILTVPGAVIEITQDMQFMANAMQVPVWALKGHPRFKAR